MAERAYRLLMGQMIAMGSASNALEPVANVEVHSDPRADENSPVVASETAPDLEVAL